MRVEPATTDDVDVLVDQWVALAGEQRSHGTYVLPEENRAGIREDFLRRAVTGELLLAREDPSEVVEGDGDGNGGADRTDDYPGLREGIVGFVSFGTTPGGFAEDVDRGLVSNLYVRPDRRNEGVGATLLSAAEERLADAGMTVVTLEAMADNDEARRFYRERGYAPHRVELSKSLEK